MIELETGAGDQTTSTIAVNVGDARDSVSLGIGDLSVCKSAPVAPEKM